MHIRKLPIMKQPGYIRKALEAGKHVLSEKPITENVKDGVELLKWYNSEIKPKVTWSIAENFRYLNSFDRAAEEVAKLGKIMQFRVRVQTIVDSGKYLSKFYGRNSQQRNILFI
jgi:predicted dehydrogenase